MNQLEEVLADAARIAKSANGAAPRFGHKAFEDAMCTLAEREARAGESVGASLSRMHADHDERLTALAKAAYLAETAEAALAEQRARTEVAELRKLFGGKADDGEAPPRHGSRGHVAALMEKAALAARRPEETLAQSWSRLLRDDAAVRDAYAYYCEAPE